MRRTVVACTGWSYPEWVGVFYPPGTPQSEFLAQYARTFRFVEVNSAYHRAPARQAVERWASVTPPDFRFSVKMPDAIVLDKRLAHAEDDVERFLAALTPLRVAGKLERVVCQLTPSFSFGSHFANLEAFLESWAPRERFVVELRNASWWREETYALLRKHRVPLVWSSAQWGAEPVVRRTPPVRTSETVYVRVIGDRALDHEEGDPTKPLLPEKEIHWDRTRRDGTPEIAYWRDRVEDEGRDATDAFFIINNHLSGFAPESARVAARLFGQPEPDLNAARTPILPKGQRRLGAFDS